METWQKQNRSLGFYKGSQGLLTHPGNNLKLVLGHKAGLWDRQCLEDWP